MDNKQLLAIILAIVIAGLIIGIGCFYGLSQNSNATANVTNNTTVNLTNNTTDDSANVQEESSGADSQQSTQEKIEFNGKTHSQNVLEAKQSRAQGGQCAGMSDEEIERMVSIEERDGGRI